MASKREQLEQYCINKAIIQQEAMDAEIAKLAEQCPTATAEAKGLVTVEDKAFETLMIMQGQASAPAANPSVTVPAASQPTNTATAAEQAAVRQSVLASFEQKIAVGANSSIVRYLLGRPAPEEYIPDGTQGTINSESWKKSIQDKIDNGTYVVMDDYMDEKQGVKVLSRTNYETLKNAVANNSPVKVHRGKLGTRPVGYIIRLGSGSSTGSSEEQYDRKGAQQLLTWKCNGFLGSEGQATLRLKTVLSKTDKNMPGAQKVSKTVMVDVNKMVLIDAGAYDTVRKPTGGKKTMTMKSELSFKVTDTSKTTSTNKHPTRVIRASVSAEVPVLELGAEYADKFGSTKQDLSKLPTTPEEIANMAGVLTNARLQILKDGGQLEVLKLNPEYKDVIAEAMKDLETQAPAGTNL